MLAGATGSSTVSAPEPTQIDVENTALTQEQIQVIAESVPASVTQLQGFAPPANGRDLSSIDPQFRVAADLPSGPLGIPGVVLQAYKLAANRVASETPQCKLPWFLLAGIGRIESGHAGGGNVDEAGTTRTPIRGPVLDGSLAGNEVITDTDGGRFDGDDKHDRAMGPMQFIPSTWSNWGSDANGDGEADPDNIFDATYSAGRYLCSGVTDIMSEQNKVASVLRYNRSMAYVNNVLGWATAYSTGTVPTDGIPEMADAPAQRNGANEQAERKKKEDEERAANPSSPESSKPSPSKAPEQCLGAVCIPGDLLPPAPQQQAPKKPAPRTQQARPGQTRRPATP